ncbi:MAG: ROK family protein [Lachnospiraceae bacterium]|nr:ROK family protein [Lachnospiraceae bacterium]
MKYYLGLDVGGTNLAAGVVTEDYEIVSRKSVPSGAGKSVEEIVQAMSDVSKEVLAEVGLTEADVDYWGIGMPSCVNPKTKLLVHANCFGWRNIPILDYLSRHTRLPIVLENDGRCATYGEILAGAGKDYINAIMLTLGTGVGGGIILNRKIYSGADHMGCELGHTKLIYNGRLCTCGQYGCMDAYCSARGLLDTALDELRETKEKNSQLWEVCNGELNSLTVRQIFDVWNQKDALAEKIVTQYVDHLAVGMSTLITIFRPEIIILGGGVSNAGDDFLWRVNERLKVRTFAGEEIGVPQVVRAKLGNDAGIIGAAMLGAKQPFIS